MADAHEKRTQPPATGDEMAADRDESTTEPDDFAAAFRELAKQNPFVRTDPSTPATVSAHVSNPVDVEGLLTGPTKLVQDASARVIEQMGSDAFKEAVAKRQRRAQLTAELLGRRAERDRAFDKLADDQARAQRTSEKINRILSSVRRRPRLRTLFGG